MKIALYCLVRISLRLAICCSFKCPPVGGTLEDGTCGASENKNY